MRHFILLITFLGLATATVSMTAQAAYYHHRHTIITGIMAVVGLTGTIIGPLGRGAIIMRSQLVKRCALFPTYRPQSPSASRLIVANTAPVPTVKPTATRPPLLTNPEKN